MPDSQPLLRSSARRWLRTAPGAFLVLGAVLGGVLSFVIMDEFPHGSVTVLGFVLGVIVGRDRRR